MASKQKITPRTKPGMQSPSTGKAKGMKPSAGKPKLGNLNKPTGSKMGLKGMGQASGLGISSGMKGLGQSRRKP